jgi:hypothetical protein
MAWREDGLMEFPNSDGYGNRHPPAPLQTFPSSHLAPLLKPSLFCFGGKWFFLLMEYSSEEEDSGDG